MATLTYDSLPVHGHLVRFAQAGDRHGPDGSPRPVVVLVHGIASRAAQWESVMERLGDVAHVLAPDLLGHGESAKPRGDYSLGGHASGLRDLLAALGHDRISLVGHSLGGGVAMQFAYQFPERVERLALISSGGLGREVSFVLRAAALPGAELVLPVLTSSWVRRAGTSLHALLGRTGVTLPPGVLEVMVGFASLADPGTREAFVHTCRAVLDHRGQRIDARDRLYLARDLPLFVVWGRKDAIIPVEHGQALVEHVPGTRIEVFERSGHFPHLTEPERLARVLHQWLEETPVVHLDPADLTERLRDPFGPPQPAADLNADDRPGVAAEDTR
jgi:pimeloyl-ACP methyl ester carboxylesterase